MNAVWDRDTKLIFCDICLKEVELGNRPTTHFNKDGWQNISTQFKMRTGREYTRIQFKNKWDQMKKEWKLWKELKRGSIGLGWDPIKKTIDASEEWWLEKLQVVPNAKKFRYCGIDPELEAKLDTMFSGVVATGENGWAPTFDLGVDCGETEKSQSEEGSEEQQHEPNAEADNSQRKRAESTHKRSAKKRKGNFLRDQISQLVSSTSSWKTTSSTSRVGTSIPEAVQVLDSMPEVYDDLPFYLSCIKLLEDPVKCRLEKQFADEIVELKMVIHQRQQDSTLVQLAHLSLLGLLCFHLNIL